MTLFFPPFFLLLSRGNSAEEEKVIFLFHLPHLRGGDFKCQSFFFSFYTRGTFSRAFCNKRKKAQRDVSDGRLYDSTRFP